MLQGQELHLPPVLRLPVPAVPAMRVAGGDADDLYEDLLLKPVARLIDKGLICLSCLKPTDRFFLIAGSGDFYAKTLTSFGVPPLEAIRLAANGRHLPLRRAPLCGPCAALKGYDKPASWFESQLLAGGNGRVPVKILAEDQGAVDKALAGVRRGEREEIRKREREMRIKGAQKDMIDVIEGLTDRGYLAENNGGHIKITRDGAYVTTVSSTPSNPSRTKQNVLAQVARWERANLARQEPAMEPEAEVRTRHLYEMAATVARYDDGTLAEQRALLAKEGITHDTIREWREELRRQGWHVADEPAKLPDTPQISKMCASCAQDLAVTGENWTQFKEEGRYRWSDRCNRCLNQGSPVIPPVTAEEDGTIRDGHLRVTAAGTGEIAVRAARGSLKGQIAGSADEDEPLTEGETARVGRLISRKREISRRLKEIDAEKARLVRELDEEKARLSGELNLVQDELLEVVSE